jgi:predicted lipid-binding transport protein (Tim44 family)
MREPIDITTIVFALLAIFVVWKLRSVLGTRTGNEQAPPPPRRNPADIDPNRPLGDNVVRLPGAANDAGPRSAARVQDPARWAGFAEPGSAVGNGLDAILASDQSFAIKPFIDGAKAAYEMIVTAFAAGDRKGLRNLLANDVYDSFVGAIDEREKRGEKVDTTFVSIERAQVEDAQLRGNNAQISIRFLSKLITATKDSSGKIIDGNPDKVVDMIDIWTFARDTGARDPNWKLIATEEGH